MNAGALVLASSRIRINAGGQFVCGMSVPPGAIQT